MSKLVSALQSVWAQYQHLAPAIRFQREPRLVYAAGRVDVMLAKARRMAGLGLVLLSMSGSRRPRMVSAL